MRGQETLSIITRADQKDWVGEKWQVNWVVFIFNGQTVETATNLRQNWRCSLREFACRRSAPPNDPDTLALPPDFRNACPSTLSIFCRVGAQILRAIPS